VSRIARWRQKAEPLSVFLWNCGGKIVEFSPSGMNEYQAFEEAIPVMVRLRFQLI